MPVLPFPTGRTTRPPSQSPPRLPSARCAFPAAAPSIHSSAPPSRAAASAISALEPLKCLPATQPQARIPSPGSAGILLAPSAAEGSAHASKFPRHLICDRESPLALSEFGDGRLLRGEGSAFLHSRNFSARLQSTPRFPFSWLALLPVFRHQRRNRPIVRSEVLLRNALHILFRHSTVVLRGVKQFPVITKEHLV